MILATINRALMGCSGGGFVTACCARFGPDGTGTGAGAADIAAEEQEIHDFLNGGDSVLVLGETHGPAADDAL